MAETIFLEEKECSMRFSIFLISFLFSWSALSLPVSQVLRGSSKKLSGLLSKAEISNESHGLVGGQIRLALKTLTGRENPPPYLLKSELKRIGQQHGELKKKVNSVLVFLAKDEKKITSKEFSIFLNDLSLLASRYQKKDIVAMVCPACSGPSPQKKGLDFLLKEVKNEKLRGALRSVSSKSRAELLAHIDRLSKQVKYYIPQSAVRGLKTQDLINFAAFLNLAKLSRGKAKETFRMVANLSVEKGRVNNKLYSILLDDDYLSNAGNYQDGVHLLFREIASNVKNGDSVKKGFNRAVSSRSTRVASKLDEQNCFF